MTLDILTLGEDIGNRIAKDDVCMLECRPNCIRIALQHFRVREGLQHDGGCKQKFFNVLDPQQSHKVGYHVICGLH